MAKNLRAKLPAEDTLIIHDINTNATSQFLKEIPDGVRIAANPREVAEKSVGIALPFKVDVHPDETPFLQPYD
jgi:hypothetical protein